MQKVSVFVGFLAEASSFQLKANTVSQKYGKRGVFSLLTLVSIVRVARLGNKHKSLASTGVSSDLGQVNKRGWPLILVEA